MTQSRMSDSGHQQAPPTWALLCPIIQRCFTVVRIQAGAHSTEACRTVLRAHSTKACRTVLRARSTEYAHLISARLVSRNDSRLGSVIEFGWLRRQALTLEGVCFHTVTACIPGNFRCRNLTNSRIRDHATSRSCHSFGSCHDLGTRI